MNRLWWERTLSAGWWEQLDESGGGTRCNFKIQNEDLETCPEITVWSSRLRLKRDDCISRGEDPYNHSPAAEQPVSLVLTQLSARSSIYIVDHHIPDHLILFVARCHFLHHNETHRHPLINTAEAVATAQIKKSKKCLFFFFFPPHKGNLTGRKKQHTRFSHITSVTFKLHNNSVGDWMLVCFQKTDAQLRRNGRKMNWNEWFQWSVVLSPATLGLRIINTCPVLNISGRYCFKMLTFFKSPLTVFITDELN